MKTTKVNFPPIFDKDVSSAAPKTPVKQSTIATASTKLPSIPVGKETAPPVSGIQIGTSSKQLSAGKSNEKKETGRCAAAAKDFGFGIQGPMGTPLFGPQALSAEQPKTDKPNSDELRPLTGEELRNHMIYLPPQGILSDVLNMDQSEIEKLAASINVKTRNQEIYEKHHLVAAMFFKKVLLVKDRICSIVEIEFYMENDPYLHDDLQLQQEFRFYFRRRYAKPSDDPSRVDSDGTVLVTGKKRGLYLAMGKEGAQRAILIRSIMTPQGVIEGNAAVLDYIVGVYGLSTVDQLRSLLIENLNRYNQKAKEERGMTFEVSRGLVRSDLWPIGLAVVDVIPEHCPYREQRIYHGPRVGLNLKKETEYYGKYSMHLMKPYRFTYRGDLLKMAKHFFALTARLNEIPDLTIQSDLKVAGEMVGRWSSHFSKGETTSVDMLMLPGNLSMDDAKKQCTAYGFFSRFNK